MSYLYSNQQLIKDGLSLQAQSLFQLKHDTKHSVKCIINIDNWTEWKLTKPLVTSHCGKVGAYLPVILPATREVLPTHKTYATATGSCGLASWHISGLQLRLLIMWSIPYDKTLHHSYMAVGVIFSQDEHSSPGPWFHHMYYGHHGPFKRAQAGQFVTVIKQHLHSSQAK